MSLTLRLTETGRSGFSVAHRWATPTAAGVLQVCCRASHVALSQDFVDGQQAGNLLDDHLPGEFDGPAAVVRPFSLGLIAAGFLTDGRTDGRKEGGRRDGRAERTKHQLIKGGVCGDGARWTSTVTSYRTTSSRPRLARCFFVIIKNMNMKVKKATPGLLWI